MRWRNLIAAVILVGSVSVFAVALFRDRGPDVNRYPVTWSLFRVPSNDARSVEVWVEDDHCAGGVPAAKRLRAPRISYGAATVTITLDAELSGEFQTCPKPIGPGVNTTTIELKEPIGDRRLIDGHAGS